MFPAAEKQKLARWTALLVNGAGTLAKGIRDTAIPPLCLMCDSHVAEPGGVCATCWQELRHVSQPRCPVMGTPFSVDLGEGMPSEPVYHFDLITQENELIVQTSDTELHEEVIDVDARGMAIRFWMNIEDD